MLIPENYIAPVPHIWYPILERVVPNICHNYFVSTWGLIYNGITHRILPQKFMEYETDKYITVCVLLQNGEHEWVQIHRVVMNTFFYREDSDKYEVNHLDGVKYHNWIWNLEWITHSENMEYAVKNNQFKHGEERGNSKLSNSTVERICELIDAGYNNKQIESMLDPKSIEHVNIGKILNNIRFGLSWKTFSRKYKFGANY